MTTDHPDFDALSAHLDGEAPEWDSHVPGCAACRSMVGRMRTTSALVAEEMPPLPTAAREKALARALSAFRGDENMRGTAEDSAGLGRPVPDRSSALRALPTRPSRVEPVASTASRRWWQGGSGMWVGVGSAAAVLVAFIVGAGVLTSGNGGGGGDTAASSGPAGQERSATGLADSGSPATVFGGGAGSELGGAAVADGAGGVDGGDLGEVADSPALAARARPELARRNADAARGSPPAASVTGAGEGVSGGPVAGLQPTPKVVGTRPCEMEARSARPDLGTVVYFATGRVDGSPVVVLGFAPGPAPAPVTLLALAQSEGCRTVLEAAGP